MRRLHLLVEGQTEEVLCDLLFIPHLQAHGWTAVTRSILRTKRLASGAKFRGGVSGWEQVQREIGRLLSSFDVVSTVIDYYGFPDAAPGMGDRPVSSPEERVRHVERSLAEAVNNARFIPHLSLHETESWVFAAAGPLAELVGDAALERTLRKELDDAGGAEAINDHPDTAPSKRLRAQFPAYQKTQHGPLSITALGLPALRAQCPHLDAWLIELEQAAQ